MRDSFPRFSEDQLLNFVQRMVKQVLYSFSVQLFEIQFYKI